MIRGQIEKLFEEGKKLKKEFRPSGGDVLWEAGETNGPHQSREDLRRHLTKAKIMQ